MDKELIYNTHNRVTKPYLKLRTNNKGARKVSQASSYTNSARPSLSFPLLLQP